jgi:hypothetical protein
MRFKVRGRRESSLIVGLLDDLLALDESLARGTGDDYRARLTDDAVVLLPGIGALDRETCAAAVDADPGPPWGDITITEPRLLTLGEDAAAIAYRFASARGATPYVALMSSVYVRDGDGWQLALHQQTPLG